jgi:hypothetical protein
MSKSVAYKETKLLKQRPGQINSLQQLFPLQTGKQESSIADGFKIGSQWISWAGTCVFCDETWLPLSGNVNSQNNDTGARKSPRSL